MSPETDVRMNETESSSVLIAWQERARAVLSGKQSNFRPGPDVPPVIADRAEGMRIIDVAGKDYIDFTLGMGPGIFGHNNPDIRAAVSQQMDRQMIAASGAMHHVAEIELAERIVEHVPCAERVRFGISGTEADQMVMRLARGATGRRYVLRFESHYHGWVDNAFGGRRQGDTPAPEHGLELGAGLAQNAHADVLLCPWNNVDELKKVLQERGHEIALVLMEAVMCNTGCCPPLPGYLETVRNLCDAHDVLLCFDEVITGFRMGIGGAQSHYGVTPDLAVFGKAMAGGLPLSALAGRKELMDYLANNRVLGGGTFNSFPLAVATGIAGIDMLAADDGALYLKMDQVQGRIATALSHAANANGFDLLVQGPRGFLFFAFCDLNEIHHPADLLNTNAGLAMKLRAHMEQSGVLVAGGSRLVISPFMTEEEIEATATRFETAFSNLAKEV